MWMEHLQEMKKSRSLCGVNEHHQNGKVEKRIRDLQDIARSSILHAQNLWPETVNNNLWPYAIRKGAHDLNSAKHKLQDRSPLEKFGQVQVNIRSRYFYPFGCPMCVLQTTGAFKGPKWSSMACLVIYIGPSMTHASSIGLELSLQTGLVSPVFYMKYDDTFNTV
jgi:hypothetical protein